MKKYAFILLCCLFALASCASNNVELQPVKKDVPQIEIVVKGAAVTVTCYYHGAGWLFIKGVEFRNASGDTRRVIFSNPRRSVGSTGRVYETGAAGVAYSDEFLAWCGENVEARAVCDYTQEFAPVKVTREN